jgi:hypothetical protein
MKLAGSVFSLSLCFITLAGVTTSASPVSSGNLLIYRVGTGSGALGTTATAVFLDEYTPLGSLVQSIALPTTGSGELTAIGNATTEGIMSVVNNGTPQAQVVFTGYRADAGVATATAQAANKVIGLVGLTGVPDTTSFAVTDAGTVSMRSATSTDGSSLFYIGTSGQVRYVGTPGPAATSVSIDVRNSRQVRLDGTKLFASNGSTAITGKVQEYGNLPTTTTAAVPDVVLATTDAVNGFAVFDLNSGVAGADTIYALSTVVNQLVKWTFNGTTWTASGFISAGSAQNITGYADAGGVHLFLTSGSTLYSELDASGYGANITGSLTTLASAAANTGFRGISVIPEPSTFCLALLAAASLLVVQRRRS